MLRREGRLLRSVSKRRGRPTTDDRRGLTSRCVVFQRRHHEQGEVHAKRDVALEDGVADVVPLNLEALAIPSRSLPHTTVHSVPLGEHAPACLDLVVEVRDADQPLKPGYFTRTGRWSHAKLHRKYSGTPISRPRSSEQTNPLTGAIHQ